MAEVRDELRRRFTRVASALHDALDGRWLDTEFRDGLFFFAARFVLITAAVSHGVIAWALFIGTSFAQSASMQTLRYITHIPDTVWPWLFVVAAASAILGYFWVAAVRVHLLIGGILLLSWAIADLSLWDELGPRVLGVILLHFVYIKILFAIFTERLLAIFESSHRLLEVAERAQRELPQAGSKGRAGIAERD